MATCSRSGPSASRSSAGPPATIPATMPPCASRRARFANGWGSTIPAKARTIPLRIETAVRHLHSRVSCDAGGGTGAGGGCARVDRAAPVIAPVPPRPWLTPMRAVMAAIGVAHPRRRRVVGHPHREHHGGSILGARVYGPFARAALRGLRAGVGPRARRRPCAAHPCRRFRKAERPVRGRRRPDRHVAPHRHADAHAPAVPLEGGRRRVRRPARGPCHPGGLFVHALEGDQQPDALLHSGLARLRRHHG